MRSQEKDAISRKKWKEKGRSEERVQTENDDGDDMNRSIAVVSTKNKYSHRSGAYSRSLLLGGSRVAVGLFAADVEGLEVAPAAQTHDHDRQTNAEANKETDRVASHVA